MESEPKLGDPHPDDHRYRYVGEADRFTKPAWNAGRFGTALNGMIGHITTFVYDENDRLIEIQEPPSPAEE